MQITHKKVTALIVSSLLIVGMILPLQSEAFFFKGVKDQISSLQSQLNQVQDSLSAQALSASRSVQNARINSQVAARTDVSELERGDRGERVVELQQELKNLGLYTGRIDGNYGRGTRAAVQRLQRSEGLAVTGVADVQVQSALLVEEAQTGLTSQLACSTTMVERFTPDRGRYWNTNSVTASDHPEIERYRIQWFNGDWSSWYKPGQGDQDWKSPQQLVWRYFTDHNYEVESCGGTFTPQNQSSMMSSTVQQVNNANTHLSACIEIDEGYTNSYPRNYPYMYLEEGDDREIGRWYIENECSFDVELTDFSFEYLATAGNQQFESLTLRNVDSGLIEDTTNNFSTVAGSQVGEREMRVNFDAEIELQEGNEVTVSVLVDDAQVDTLMSSPNDDSTFLIGLREVTYDNMITGDSADAEVLPIWSSIVNIDE